jgi:hypothetical protein
MQESSAVREFLSGVIGNPTFRAANHTTGIVDTLLAG